MANFNGTARSNYFKVKDPEAFLAWVSKIPGLGHWVEEDSFAIYSDDGDTGCWPSSWYEEDDEGGGVDHDVDIVSELPRHLQEGQVAVLIGAGAEKLCYISGNAVAVDHTGKVVQVNLNDIYSLAAKEFGVTPTVAEY